MDRRAAGRLLHRLRLGNRISARHRIGHSNGRDRLGNHRPGGGGHLPGVLGQLTPHLPADRGGRNRSKRPGQSEVFQSAINFSFQAGSSTESVQLDGDLAGDSSVAPSSTVRGRRRRHRRRAAR